MQMCLTKYQWVLGNQGASLILILISIIVQRQRGNRKGLPLQIIANVGSIPCGCPHRTFRLHYLLTTTAMPSLQGMASLI
jgi:hypothetical protein